MTVILNNRKDVLGGFSFAKYFNNIVTLHVCISLPFILCCIIHIHYFFGLYIQTVIFNGAYRSILCQGSAKNLPKSCTSKMKPRSLVR